MFGISWLDPQTLITEMGGFAVFVILAMVFTETGLLVGFFLPGDSLLFLTGLATANGFIQLGGWPVPVWLMCTLISVTAFLGDQTGYFIGRKSGPAIFNKPESKLFNHKNVEKTHAFFDRYGARAVILARFVPILRALIPMLAGISQMDAKRFFRLNLIGATIWVAVFMFPGYWLGGISWVKENLEITVIAIVVGTSLLLPIELLRDYLTKKLKKSKTD